MPLPSRMLNAGEEIVVDVRPTGWALAVPVLLTVAALAAAIAGIALDAPTAVRWGLVVVLAAALVYLLGRYVRWRSTSLVVTTDRLVHRSGIVVKSGREIPLSALTDISYRQTLVDRIIGAGDLRLESAGRDSAEVFPALPHPAEIQNEIYKLTSARRDGVPLAGLSLPEQLERLDALRQRGVLSDAEFESSKTRLLQGR